MGIERWMDMGEDIASSVTSAIETGNFASLGQEIENSLNDALRDTGIDINIYQQARRYNVPHPTAREEREWQRMGTMSNRYKSKPFLMVRPSRVTSWIEIILGGIFGVSFGLGTLAVLPVIAVVGLNIFWAVMGLIFLVITGFGFYAFGRGISKKKLLDYFYRYSDVIGERTYIDVRELSMQAGQTEEKCLQSLKKMIKKGFLPYGRFDEEYKTLMITDDVYKQYLQTLQQRKEAEENEAKDSSAKPEERQYSEEVQSVLDEGHAYIRTIRECNDEIPDDVLSDKLDRLELIVSRIFEQVEKNPDAAKDLHRLMDYYLPTVVKLLRAYIDLDNQPGAGENIAGTKREIEGVIDTINNACEKMLDSLFEEMAWDISSDISVMKSMMEQDGLLDKKEGE